MGKKQKINNNPQLELEFSYKTKKSNSRINNKERNNCKIVSINFSHEIKRKNLTQDILRNTKSF
jgi:hypothetical protein